MAQMVGTKPESSGMYNHEYKSKYSIASIDFGELVPVRKKDLVPRHKIKNFKGRGFLRLAPQVFPAYGRCTFNTAAFACPESQILESAEAFHDGKLVYKGKAFNLPYAYFSSMIKMFTSRAVLPDSSLDDNNSLCVLVKHASDLSGRWYDLDVVPSLEEEDYSYIDEKQYNFIAPYVASIEGTNYILWGFYRLTRFGCRYYKILKGCGFDFPSFGNESTYETGVTLDGLFDKYAKTPFNLMPFLAYCHIFQDYFLNPNMYATSQFVQYLHQIHDLEAIYSPDNVQWYYPNSGAMSTDLIHFFLTNIRVPHHRGLYLNSWNTPLSPLGDNQVTNTSYPESDSIIGPYLPNVSASYQENVDITGDRNTPSLFNVNPSNPGTSVGFRFLTVFGQRFLNNIYQYCRRNGLFGSKYWEQFWSRFGIKPNDYNVQHCSKLFDSSQDIDFSAVMSNADTGANGKTLGDYAGFGIGSLNFNFNYKSSEFGYIFVISWLQPIPIMLHGVDPAGLRRTYLDYWNALWDGKTLRAIPMMEISFAKRGDRVPSSNGDRKIFGYCNLYDEMRNERDIVLGDFVTSSAARNFLFCRDLGFWRSHTNNKLAPQSNNVHYLPVPLYESDLSDVFQMSYKNGDRFYLQFTFDITEQSPVKSDSSALDLNGEGEQLMEIGGSSLS